MFLPSVLPHMYVCMDTCMYESISMNDRTCLNLKKIMIFIDEP